MFFFGFDQRGGGGDGFGWPLFEARSQLVRSGLEAPQFGEPNGSERRAKEGV